MRRFGLIGAWALATAVVTGVAWNVVGAAGSRVADGTATQVISLPEITVETETSSTTSSSSGVDTTMSGTDPTTTTTPSSGGSSTSTTQPASSAILGTGEWTAAVAVTPGGTVVYSHRNGEVRLDAVSPVAGWSYEVHKNTSTDIEVRFDIGYDDTRVRIRWTSSGLEVDLD